MAHTALQRVVEQNAECIAPLSRVHDLAHYQYRLARDPIGGVHKRALDIAISAIALAALSPFLLLISFLICVESSGPALYRQQRTGFRGRAFTVLKFRTMRVTEAGDRIVQARPGDARVTPIGRFLRHTSIDELPQLLNVLLGDMSLVGPRPHAVRHDRQFFHVDRSYTRRFLARPGITGAAQVAGARGVTDTAEKVEARLQLDLDYVDNWSLRRDLLILCATIKVLLGDQNAC